MEQAGVFYRNIVYGVLPEKALPCETIPVAKALGGHYRSAHSIN